MKAVYILNEAIGKRHSHGFLEGDKKHPVSREMTSVHLKALCFCSSHSNSNSENLLWKYTSNIMKMLIPKAMF